MDLEMIVLNSEPKFRYYVVLNYQSIDRIIIFADRLENVIFFYCYQTDNFIVAASEYMYRNFSFYQKTYSRIARKINFTICDCAEQLFAIELIPK